MKNYQPDYYNKFKCIADKCSITCCQEWKIAVDEATNRKWKKLSADKVSGKSDNLSSYTCHKDGSLVIKLDEKHRCPFLSKDKLCHLVMTYSDEVLSETCTLFPREIHRFSTHEERTLMPCCPAVIDLWCEKPVTFPVISETMDNLSPAFLIRDNLIKLISDQGLSVEQALLDELYILLELHKNQPITKAHIQEYFSGQFISRKSENLSSYTCHKDGSRVIKLDEKHRCPFLSKDKLCHLVMTYSDEVLSETCTLFPREIHRFSTHEERTLMPCCPAVIDLWCEKPVTFPVISETMDNLSPAFLIRDNLIKLISDQGLSVEQALLDELYILLELHKNQPITKAHIQEYFSGHTLNELNTAMEDIHIPDEDTFIKCSGNLFRFYECIRTVKQ